MPLRGTIWGWKYWFKNLCLPVSQGRGKIKKIMLKRWPRPQKTRSRNDDFKFLLPWWEKVRMRVIILKLTSHFSLHLQDRGLNIFFIIIILFSNTKFSKNIINYFLVDIFAINSFQTFECFIDINTNNINWVTISYWF